VNVQRKDPHVVLSVTDTGCGINAAFLPHVFEMYRQAEATSRRTEAGLGIGLSIVRRLVELHGGTVAVSSTGLDHGAAFTVSLPHQAQDVQPLRTACYRLRSSWAGVLTPRGGPEPPVTSPPEAAVTVHSRARAG
jgi:K+-sensing histidine kinase KdpD